MLGPQHLAQMGDLPATPPLHPAVLLGPNSANNDSGEEMSSNLGTDQRWVVGQAEMQVVPCLAAAHGEQRGLSLGKEPAGGQEGRTGQEPASKKALTHFIQREVKALGREGVAYVLAALVSAESLLEVHLGEVS